MRIAICDDAKEFRAELERKIKDSGLIPDAVFENYSSGEELLSALECKEAFSIIFLDVEMSGINGIQTARKIREHNKNCVLIFVSSHASYVWDSFESEPLYFLTKPVDDEKLSTALSLAKARIERREGKIDIVSKEGITSVPINEIIYVELYKKRLTYHCVGRNVEVPGKIGDVVLKLDKHGFILVNQGTVVNMEHVRQIVGPEIKLSDGSVVTISVRRKAEVIGGYMEFIKNR